MTKPIRLWPGVGLAVAMVAMLIGGPIVFPDQALPVGLIGFMAGGVVLALWWLFFSRLPWIERLGALVLIAAAILAGRALAHPSITGAGQGMLMYILPVPVMLIALVIWAAVTRNLSTTVRRLALVVAVVLGALPFQLMRTDGVSSEGFQTRWRWTPTAEAVLLATTDDEPKPLPPPAVAEMPKDVPVAEAESKAAAAAPKTETLDAAPMPAPVPVQWPGFRGPLRDSVIRNVRINTDWATSPPVEVWRRKVGPGWSSFSVRGDLIYTQEQRGEEELVTAYRLSTGEPVWRHRDAVRFYESNGGAGPRATPTISGNRVFSYGATGLLNALDADTGKKLWSRDASKDSGREVSFWGFTSSPLVVDDIVVVAAAGTLVAYDIATGEPRWQGPSHGGSYSSPHRLTLDGVDQIVLLGGPGAISVAPKDGTVLWKHSWMPGPIVQPGITEDGDLLVNAITATGGQGTRRVHVTHSGDTWNLEEKWTSNGLKPYFNDFVVHKGHAYGFDGAILSSINLQDGKRNWKGGRYGNGQMILLADQDLLLITSEDGDIVLVSATTDQYREVAKFHVFESKTWNHPVLIGNTLLIRNGEEMAAFKLSAPPTVSSADGARH